ncbi:FAD-dependent oxidoreductase [Cellulomonas soli]|uniref:FAD-dependent oxidoreductase n=1 Tax=Cellulomonas soli TaxID=931535 RepID=A0A512PD43_9CELL|nr:FAD-dependent oxidoreductase [Cellulomonas soli]NYI60226.1 electron transfer flavoprotein-quinone oxidoreductase [Cellulomonas soli]GEP69120.1 FAD-dependent oxidoreductase [Cellulomonas soli]
MEDEAFDVVVVGAGIAGCVAAYRLAEAGHSVVLIERGSAAGAKNLSGGVFYCRVMEQVFPGFVRRAPVERVITRNCISMTNATSAVTVDYRDERLAEPVNAVTVLRARLDSWLAEQCEEAGVMVMPGVRVDELLLEGGQVVGVRAGDDELRARVVIAADGVNSFLARQAGIRPTEPLENLAVGVKSVIRLPREVIEERFSLTGDEGVAYAMVGDCTQGIAGGAFLYTNTASLSLGVVLRLDDLVASGRSSSEVHDHLLAHPSVAPLIEGGELLEYGCHLTIEGGPQMARRDLTRPGLMVVGDAAGLTLNTGLTIRGMDLAAGSAIAAATAADRALRSGDLSQRAMDVYRTELDGSFVGADLATYARAPHFLESALLYRDAGPLAADVLHGVFDHDLTPRRHLVGTARSAVKSSPVSAAQLARLGLSALRSL